MIPHIGLVEIDQPGKHKQRHDVSADERPDDAVTDPFAKVSVLQSDLILDGQRFPIRDLVEIYHLGSGRKLPYPGKGRRGVLVNRQGKPSRAVCPYLT